MKKKIKYLIVLILLVITGITFFILYNYNDDAVPLEEETLQEELNDILIIGDSIGSGVGDGEMSGLGERYLALLDEDNDDDETLTNLSVSGYDSSQLVDLIKSGENNATISNADLIIISIGGNDLNSLAFQRNLDLPVAFEETLTTYLDNMDAIITDIRTLNPEAQVALIGLYNPYSVIVPELTSYLLEWNDETRAIVESDPGSTYIPTYDLFQNHLSDYLYVDLFHPNEEGYQAIAQQLYALVN